MRSAVSPLVGSHFLPAKPVKTESLRPEHRGFVSSTSAVDYCPKASSLASVCCKWLQGIAGSVGRASGMEALTDVPGFRRTRHRRKASPEGLGDRFLELHLNAF